MNKLKLAFTILMLIILFIFLIKIFKTNNNLAHYKNILPRFSFEKFKNECGDKIINVGDFTKTNGQVSHYPSQTTKHKLIDWFDKNNQFLKFGNKSTKVSFGHNSKHHIAKFMINWVKNNYKFLPKSLKVKKLQDCEYTLRISRGQWEFPCHFDEVDNYMLVLSGNRYAKLNGKNIILKPRDILYFEKGVDHCFKCKSKNDLNIVLNIVFKSNKKINKSFSKQYPRQLNRIINKIEQI